jgi:S-DNA-T family DNA segregation ATPase FtsK/SpoIIIE
VNIITGNIKANMPSRIALAVASIHDSRTILDSLGAERLIGSGDMLYAPLDAPKPRRIQGSFVHREDIVKVVTHLCDQGEPTFDIVPSAPTEEDDFAAEMEASDELFNAAAEYVIGEQQASVSMLQRRFKIGYARAGRLIDMMEQAGIVGPHEGSKPRDVLGSIAMLHDDDDLPGSPEDCADGGLGA